MDIQWSDLLAGLAILLVFEGLFPFVNPSRARASFERLARLGDRELRGAGLLSMGVGLGLLFFARA